MRYDLVVIGNDSAALGGALAAATMNKRVALVEQVPGDAARGRNPLVGVPSRILRDAILHLTHQRESVIVDASADRNLLADQRRPIEMRELKHRVKLLLDRDTFAVRDQLDRNGVDLYRGSARFARPHDVIVHTANGDTRLEAGSVLLACGTTPLRPRSIPFDGRRVFDVDGILELETLPESLILVGAGVSGIEAGLLLASLGVRVTVIDGHDHLLDSCDRDVTDLLLSHARGLGITFHLGEEVIAVERLKEDRVTVHFAGGERLIGDCLLYAGGRVGNTAELDLSAAGIEPDERGRLWCDESQRTWSARVYAAGTVVGFPTLPGTSADQGRRAVYQAFGQPYCGARHARFQLQALPTVAAVGSTEDQLAREQVAYDVVCLRSWSPMSERVETLPAGLLKLLFDKTTRVLLGVHGVGEEAMEAARIGQTVMSAEGTLDDFWRKALSSPTMVACCDRALAAGACRRRIDRPSESGQSIVPHVGSAERETAASGSSEKARA